MGYALYASRVPLAPKYKQRREQNEQANRTERKRVTKVKSVAKNTEGDHGIILEVHHLYAGKH